MLPEEKPQYVMIQMESTLDGGVRFSQLPERVLINLQPFVRLDPSLAEVFLLLHTDTQGDVRYRLVGELSGFDFLAERVHPWNAPPPATFS